MNPTITNPPVATPFFFYLLAATMIIGGILVITRKNAIHSAMALITTLLAQAGLYLMLYAPFVAGVQIILYAGGIMVLFLFVIMLINLERNMKERQFNKQWLVGIAAATALGGLFIAVYTSSKGRALFPEGRVTYVDEGVFRVIHRKEVDRKTLPHEALGPAHSFLRQDAEPLTPGEVARIRFSLYPTSVLLRKGHRIRVALAGADASLFQRYPPEGTPTWTVYREAQRTSSIELPVRHN